VGQAFLLSRKVPFALLTKKNIYRWSFVKQVNLSFLQSNQQLQIKKIKLMVEAEVNDAKSDDDSDNEQL
jgi:hypothetical protein